MYNRYIKDKNVKGKQNGIEMELINKRQVSFNIKSISKFCRFFIVCLPI